MTAWRARLPFLVYAACAYLAALAAGIIVPLIPMLVDSVLDEHQASLHTLSHWSGLVAAAAPLTMALTIGIWLQAVRQGHGKWLLRLLCVIGGVLLAAIAKAHSREELLVLRLGFGLVGGLPILLVALAPSLGRPRESGRLAGWIRAMLLSGAVLGAPAGGLLARYIGLTHTCLLAGLVSLVGGLLLTAFLDLPLLVVEAPTDAELAPENQWATTQPALWSGTMLLLQAGIAAVVPMLALHIMEGLEVDYGWVSTWTGIAVGAMGLAGLIMYLCVELIADLLPIRTALVLGCLMATALTWQMGRAHGIVELIAWSVAWSGMMTALVTILLCGGNRHQSPIARQMMGGWLISAELVGASIGPLAAGWGAALQPRLMFAVSGILTLAAVPLITALQVPRLPPESTLGRFAPPADTPPAV